MNSGYFFSLDLEASRLEEDVTVFRYTDLPAYISGDYPMSPKYPISVVITNQTAKFLLHYCIYRVELEDDNTKERIYRFTHRISDIKEEENKSIKEAKIFHMEETLLELPYTNGLETLPPVLKKLYSSRFPIPQNDDNGHEEDVSSANYMLYLLRCRYEGERREDSAYKEYNDVLKYYRNVDKVRNCYSALKVWGLRCTEKKGNGEYELYHLEEDKDKGRARVYDKFLRKLFLDFLFDMEHSDVFQSSVYFDEMYSGLTSDFFFLSILRKSEFYYQRELVTEVYEGKDAIGGENNHKIYAGYLDRAEKEWLECILSPEAERHFYFVPNWYEKKEHTDWWKYLKRSISSWGQMLCPRFVVHPNSWFADTEEELQRVLFDLSEYKVHDKKGKVCIAPMNEICNSHWLANLTKNGASQELGNRQKKVSLWLLKRYNFTDALRLAAFNGANWIVVVVFALFSFVVLNDVGQSKCIQNLDTIIREIQKGSFLYPFLALISIVYYFYREWLQSCKRTFVKNLWNNYGENKLLYRLALIFLLCAPFIVVTLFDIKWGWSIGLFVLGWIFITLCFAWVYQENSGIKIFPTFPNYIHFFFPRLIASIAAAWMTIALSEDLFKAFFDVEWSVYSSSLIVLVLLAFIYYEVNKILPNNSFLSKIARTSELLLISFVLSIIVGVLVINFTGERLLERSGYLEEYYEEHVLEDKIIYGYCLGMDSVYKDSVENIRKRVINDSIGDESTARLLLKALENKIRKDLVKDETAARMLLAPLEARLLNDSIKNDTLLLIKHANSHEYLSLLRHVYKGSPENKIAVIKSISGYQFFILRDFLIQFAFVAMFIGIFIQLIFEEKNITES